MTGITKGTELFFKSLFQNLSCLLKISFNSLITRFFLLKVSFTNVSLIFALINLIIFKERSRGKIDYSMMLSINAFIYGV